MLAMIEGSSYKSNGDTGLRDGRGEEDRASSPSTPPAGRRLKGLGGLMGRELGRELSGCVRERVLRS